MIDADELNDAPSMKRSLAEALPRECAIPESTELAEAVLAASRVMVSVLQHLPIDAVKIDRSFVSGLRVDGYETLIIESVVKLAHARGIAVVAEGVEVQDELDQVCNLGCDYGQGFFWGRSFSPEGFVEWLGSHRPVNSEPSIRHGRGHQ